MMPLFNILFGLDSINRSNIQYNLYIYSRALIYKVSQLKVILKNQYNLQILQIIPNVLVISLFQYHMIN